MKHLFKTLYILMLALQASCASAQKKLTTSDSLPCIGMLHPLSQNTLEVKKGDIFCYPASVHGSVGLDAEYSIENTDIVKFHSSKVEYEHKEKMKEHMSGADAATKTFAFQALQSGEASVIIKEIFRGEVRQTHTFKIIVK